MGGAGAGDVGLAGHAGPGGVGQVGADQQRIEAVGQAAESHPDRRARGGAIQTETGSPLVGSVPATHSCQLLWPSWSGSAKSAEPSVGRPHCWNQAMNSAADVGLELVGAHVNCTVRRCAAGRRGQDVVHVELVRNNYSGVDARRVGLQPQVPAGQIHERRFVRDVADTVGRQRRGASVIERPAVVVRSSVAVL